MGKDLSRRSITLSNAWLAGQSSASCAFFAASTRFLRGPLAQSYARAHSERSLGPSQCLPQLPPGGVSRMRGFLSSEGI